MNFETIVLSLVVTVYSVVTYTLGSDLVGNLLVAYEVSTMLNLINADPFLI